MTVSLSLTVNDALIRTDYFVEAFIDHTVGGMIESLEGTGKIGDLNLSVDSEKVTVKLNGAVVPTNAFVTRIIRSTMFGMVSTLKGVTEPKKLTLTIKK
jgi:hypothetical protein